MGEQRNYELEVIFTFISGAKCTDNYEKIIDFAEYLYNDCISLMGLVGLCDEIRQHILNIYPQLNGIVYNVTSGISIEKWMHIQKKKFGEYLPICKINDSLANIKMRKRGPLE